MSTRNNAAVKGSAHNQKDKNLENMMKETCQIERPRLWAGGYKLELWDCCPQT